MDQDVSGAQQARSASADASALGYLALGLTLLAFGLLSTDVIDNAAAADASRLALFVGGITQFVAGMWEFYRGSSFTGTAFAALGAFWITWSGATGASAEVAGLFMIMWTLLAFSLTLAAWQMGAAAQASFGLLTVATLLMGVSSFADNAGLGKTGGWFAVVAGAAAWYGATASLTNAAWGRSALPALKIALPHRHAGGTA